MGRNKKKRINMPKQTAPSYQQTIAEILLSTGVKDRKGTSAQAIIKMVAAQRGVDVDKARGQVKLALKKMVATNQVKQLKGVGATGSFRLIKAPVDAKSYRTPGATKSLPKTMKTVKKVLEGKPVTKKTKKKPAKKTAPKPSAGAKKAAAASTAKAPKPTAAKKAPAKKAPAAKKPAAAKAPASSAKKAKK